MMCVEGERAREGGLEGAGRRKREDIIPAKFCCFERHSSGTSLCNNCLLAVNLIFDCQGNQEERLLRSRDMTQKKRKQQVSNVNYW